MVGEDIASAGKSRADQPALVQMRLINVTVGLSSASPSLSPLQTPLSATLSVALSPLPSTTLFIGLALHQGVGFFVKSARKSHLPGNSKVAAYRYT